ncbi:tetratricopeptide (TPR) repeat protein [Streptacidiphilus sp. MAP12-20]|uniref:ATP-binding protein n=1 Tax=Streptacidiphilus sp. MAP12-20 TaxID=3156299 RepID=UPI0035175DCD
MRADLSGRGSYAVACELVYRLAVLRRRQVPRWRRVLGGAGKGAVQSLPEVLGALVPGLGPLWAAGKQVTESALRAGSMPGDSLVPWQQTVVSHIADAVLQLARSGPPVVLVVDDLQRIDQGSLSVLHALVQRLPGEPLSLVVGYDGTGGPAAGSVGDLDELLRRWSSHGRLERHRLEGLPLDAVTTLVTGRLPHAPAGLPDAIVRATGGHPLLVGLCLEAWLPEHGTSVPLPETLSELVEGWLAGLDAQDREIILAAAVQGRTFLSSTVAEVTGLPADVVLERLRLLARSRRMIVGCAKPEWAADDQADAYSFGYGAVWQVVYRGQTDEQRRSRHAAIASALGGASEGGASGGGGARTPSTGRRLEWARHLEFGGVPCYEQSAVVHYELARNAAVEGLAFADAERYCQIAITASRALPHDRPDRDRRLVAAIELLLCLTEVNWRGLHTPGGGPEIDALAAEAEQAAARVADPALIARTTLLRGKTLLVTRGLVPSLEKLGDAVACARRLDDPVALFVSLVEYGRQVSKRRLAAGLAALREAEERYATDPALGGSEDPVLQHARNLAEMQLGITLHDSGELGDAHARLLRCTDRLRTEPLRAELPIALNYLAQNQLLLGLTDDAERTLREAREFAGTRGADSAWHAYNTALLAFLCAREPARREEAVALAEQAWLETQRTWLANLNPIVRNLYADVLLQAAPQDDKARELVERLATDTYLETQETDMVRSEIAAQLLRSRVATVSGNTADAVRHAESALTRLAEVGAMPALRTEEVYFYAAHAFHAAGRATEADALLQRSRTEVQRKAASLDDTPDLRRSFLTAEPLNARILGSHPYE